MIDKFGLGDKIEWTVERKGKVIDSSNKKTFRQWLKRLFRLRIIFISISKNKNVLIVFSGDKIIIKEKKDVGKKDIQEFIHNLSVVVKENTGI